MHKYQFSLILIIIFVSGCHQNGKTVDNSSKRKENNFPIIINLEKQFKKNDDILLSEIVNHIEYLPLETKNESLIRYVNDLECTDEYLFIQTGGDVLQFDNSGHILGSIIKPGRGPHEDFCRALTIDRTNKLVYIYGNYKHKIFSFNFNGKFINSFDDPFLQGSRGHYTDNIFYFNNFLLSSYAIFEPHIKSFFSAYDTKSHKIVYECNNNYEVNISNKIVLITSANYFQRFNGNLLFKEQYSDTIFQTQDFKTIIPRYIINLGKHKLTFSESMRINTLESKPIQNKYYIQDYLETTGFLFIYIRGERKKFLVVYNKVTGKTRITEGLHLKNDLDGGPDFKAFDFINNNWNYHDQLFCAVEAGEMLLHGKSDKTNNKFKSTEGKDNLQNLITRLNENDNPVLMKVYLKNNCCN